MSIRDDLARLPRRVPVRSRAVAPSPRRCPRCDASILIVDGTTTDDQLLAFTRLLVSGRRNGRKGGPHTCATVPVMPRSSRSR